MRGAQMRNARCDRVPRSTGRERRASGPGSLARPFREARDRRKAAWQAFEFRARKAKDTQDNLQRVIPLAQRLSAAGPRAPLLARLDSGFDSAALMSSIEALNAPGLPQVDWLIKWNPRGADAAGLVEQLDAQRPQLWHTPRAGKRVALWEDELRLPGIERPLRRVLRLVERTIDRRGQQLVVPEYELQGWSTSLPAARFSTEEIVALYAAHGTHEQFHAEFKSELDLERLPSGKFDTNYLVCQLAALAMNILRLMGQSGLLGPGAPVRHSAKRRRIKTAMQELIYRAGRLIETGRRIVLGLRANDRSAAAFKQMHQALAGATQHPIRACANSRIAESRHQRRLRRGGPRSSATDAVLGEACKREFEPCKHAVSRANRLLVTRCPSLPAKRRRRRHAGGVGHGFG